MPKAKQEASARPRRSVGLIKPNPLLRGAFPACIAIALLVLGSQGVRATTVLMTFSAGNDQTWTCPLGVTNVTVECWGAGGAGGSVNSKACNAGGGGGGGYIKMSSVRVTPGNTYTFTVPAGPAGPDSTGLTNLAHSDGGNTTFPGDNGNVTAQGGIGGASGTTGGNRSGGGHRHQTGGDVNHQGGDGATGTSSPTWTCSGGGGGGAGDNGSGANGIATNTPASGGSGSSNAGGQGGAGRTTNNNGNAGATPGGGGGGAKSGGTSYFQGGKGGDGKLILTYSFALPCYKSVVSGNWSAASTWAYSFDHLTWTTNVTPPTAATADAVFITNGCIVTVDSAATETNLVIDSTSALIIGSAGSLDGGVVVANILNHGAINDASSTSHTFSGIISGPGSLTHSGAGTLTLSGSNTYGGVTTVSAGTLLVNGNSSAVTNVVMVASGATFGGTNSTSKIGGTVTYQPGAKALFAVTPVATGYSNSTYMTFATSMNFNSTEVHLRLPSNLAAGTYVLATNSSANPPTGDGFTTVIDSGSITFDGTTSIAIVGNSLILTVSPNTGPVPTLSGATNFADAFSTTYRTASAAQSFPVTGTNLVADITATASPSFEVSSDGGTTYGTVAIVANNSGSASGTLSIRLAATAPVGTYNSLDIVVLTSLGAASVTGTSSANGNAVARSANLPNIIFILADDLGIDNVSCYGADNFETPNLDTLAAGGLRFERCYASPVCGPTRALLMTGRYAFRTGMTSNQTGNLLKPDKEVMMPRVLKPAGYITAQCGKWEQLPLQPSDWGFDEYLRFEDSGKYWNYQNNGDSYTLNGANVPLLDGEYLPEKMHEFVVDFITRHLDQPFYIYYSLSHVHSEILPTPDTPPGTTDQFKLYQDNVAYMDKLVGRLATELERLNLRTNTLIVFAGDNGTASPYYRDCTIDGKRLSGHKVTMLEGGMLVPCFASWPGKIAGGQVTSALINICDFFPTLAEIAGANLPTGVTIDGRGFAPQLLGQSQDWPRKWIYVHWQDQWFNRDSGWKLNHLGQLFDMSGAPFAEPLVSANTQDPAAVAARQRLQSVLDQLNPAGGGSPAPQPVLMDFSVSGTTLSLSAINRSPFGTWTLLQSTNLALPLSLWETSRVGTYDSSGNLSTNILNAVTNNLQFYILQE